MTEIFTCYCSDRGEAARGRGGGDKYRNTSLQRKLTLEESAEKKVTLVESAEKDDQVESAEKGDLMESAEKDDLSGVSRER